VSVAVAKLEEEVGARLLERQHGRRKDFHLTKAGELVYEYACRMIGLRNELGSALVPGKRRTVERLRLGVSEDWSSRWAGQLIGRFRERRPHVRVEVWYGPSEALFQEVREREIDLAILDAVPQVVHGNMETMWIPASVDTGESSLGQTAWLLRRRAGRSYASLEFEEDLRSFVLDQGKMVGMREKGRKALSLDRRPGERTQAKNGNGGESRGAVLQRSRL
jgi:DNA-binding transcriptional LysR family regulator